MVLDEINNLWARLTPITVEGIIWPHCVPFTDHARPDNYETLVSFPVVDEDTVTAAKKLSDYGFTFHCEEISPNVLAFTLTDEIAEYDARIEIMRNNGAVANRMKVSQWIKDLNVDSLMRERNDYITENSDD